jgi:hypothetical protein
VAGPAPEPRAAAEVVSTPTPEPEPVAVEAPALEGVAAWLAGLERAETEPGRPVTCVELGVELAPFRVARCTSSRPGASSAALYVAREDAGEVATIGALRMDEALDEVRASARSGTAVALALRPRSYDAPRIELVCSATRARCVALPLGLEPDPETDDTEARGAAAFAVTLEDTTEGTVVRVGGLPLPSSLAALAEGAPLERLLAPGEAPAVASVLDSEEELARLFRALHPAATERSREIVLVDDGFRREMLTLTEPRDRLVAVTLAGTMPDVWEQQTILQLVDARASGVAVLTSSACFEAPSAPARGGRWPARALGASAPFAEEDGDLLTDLPPSVRDLPDEPEGWEIQRGAVCHGNLCSGVVLAGEPAFLAAMRDLLSGARFAPATVSLTRRRACEDP